MVIACGIEQTTVWRVMMRGTSDGGTSFMLRGMEAIVDIETMKTPDIHRILNHSGSFKELGLHKGTPLTIEDPQEAMSTLLIQNGVI